MAFSGISASPSPQALKTVQFRSVAQSCPTLCDPMDCSTPGLPVHHQLPESNQTHAHWVGDAIQPSHLVVPFSSCSGHNMDSINGYWVNAAISATLMSPAASGPSRPHHSGLQPSHCLLLLFLPHPLLCTHHSQNDLLKIEIKCYHSLPLPLKWCSSKESNPNSTHGLHHWALPASPISSQTTPAFLLSPFFIPSSLPRSLWPFPLVWRLSPLPPPVQLAALPP